MTNHPLAIGIGHDPTTTPSRGEPFSKMAKTIEMNADMFGGAFVVVPPDGGGENLEVLILDRSQDIANFWIMLKSKCDMEISKVDAQQRQQSGYR